MKGDSKWNRGDIAGSSHGRVLFQGSLNIDGTGEKLLGDGRIEMAGVTTWTSSQLKFIGPGQLVNAGTFRDEGVDTEIYGFWGSNDDSRAAWFINAGQYLKSGAGRTHMATNFSSPAGSTLKVDAGRLTLSSDARLSGSVVVADGATLELGWTNQQELLDMDGSASRGELLVSARTFAVKANGNIDWGGKLVLKRETNWLGGVFGYGVPGGKLSVDGQFTTATLDLLGSEHNSGISGSEISGAGQLTVKGSAVWSGTFSGSGTTLFDGPVALGGVTELLGSRPATATLRERTVIFSDNVAWLGPVNVSEGGRMVNRGTFTEALNNDDPPPFGGILEPLQLTPGSGSFDNHGLYRKTAGWSDIGLSFANLAGATLAVEGGMLRLSGGSQLGGQVLVSESSTLQLFGTTAHLVDGMDGSASRGTLSLYGNVTFTGNSSFGGRLFTESGTFTVAADSSLTVDRVEHPDYVDLLRPERQGGSFAGEGTLIYLGPVQWTGNTGHWTQPSTPGPRNTVFASEATISAGDNIVRNRNIEFAGDTRWTGGTIAIGANGKVTNTGRFVDLNTADNVWGQLLEDGDASFVNAGSYTKSGGGTTTVNIRFENLAGATLQVDAGNLWLDRSSKLSGVVTLAQGSALRLGQRGTHVWRGLDASLGDGRVELQGASVTDTGDNYFNTLNITGATGLDASGNLVVNRLEMHSNDAWIRGGAVVDLKTLDWQGGLFADGGAITVNGNATIGAGNNGVTGRRLVLKGETTWTGTIAIGNGSITNQGEFLDKTSIEGSMVSTSSPSNSAKFINERNYVKSGAGVTTVRPLFENRARARIEVASGHLLLERDSSLSGVVTVAEGSSLRLGQLGVHTWRDLNASQGGGRVEVLGAGVTATGDNRFGTLYIDGQANVNASGTLAVNRLEMHSNDASLRGGAVVDLETLDWQGGQFLDAGTTTVHGAALISAGFNLVQWRDLVLKGETQWTGGSLVVGGYVEGGHGRIFNQGSFADLNTEDNTIAQANVSGGASFVNAGTYTKAGPGTTTILPIFVHEAGATLRVEAGILRLNGLEYTPASGPAPIERSAARGMLTTRALGPTESSSLSGLAGGSFSVLAGAILEYGGTGVVSNTASISLDGPGSEIRLMGTGADALAGLTGNTAGAALTLRNGRNLLTTGGFSNAGLLQVGAGSLFKAGGLLSNAAGATLRLEGGTISGASVLPAEPGRPGLLVNLGLVAGNGQVMTSIDNQIGARIMAEGGILTLAETVSNAGLMGAEAGGTLLLQRKLVSPTGALQLSGGTIDTNGHGLHNDGSIGGFGTLRTAGLDNAGQMQFSDGPAQVYGDVVNLAAGKIIVAGGSVTTFQGTVQARAGSEIRVLADSTAVFSAAVSQANGAAFTGSGAFHFEGGLSVGGSPGAGGAQGDVVFGAGNVYLAEIGGLLAGIGFDHFTVVGHQTFGGSLQVANWGGFEAQAGQSFDLFDWGSASGRFASIDFAAAPLADGLRWDTSRLYTTGEIGVAAVPEPGTWALWLTGLVGLGVVARRRAAVPRDSLARTDSTEST